MKRMLHEQSPFLFLPHLNQTLNLLLHHLHLHPVILGMLSGDTLNIVVNKI